MPSPLEDNPADRRLAGIMPEAQEAAAAAQDELEGREPVWQRCSVCKRATRQYAIDAGELTAEYDPPLRTVAYPERTVIYDGEAVTYEAQPSRLIARVVAPLSWWWCTGHRGEPTRRID